ncbi:inorganic phosphate transporter [Saccharospirillum alexandrii]|uniref:inorganic phosphate transporter n=1 Tax=Saccharospirillum alexandrii TaxID=2448477 RepID=UPI000FDBEF61|nr:inorganic phosphate transporter [Saccharospirillum alexandrii]
MTVIAEYGQWFVLLACLFGFFMAWGVGANDVANAMGTSVGSRALTVKQAIIIAMVFEFAGAYLAGGEVTGTIRKGIIDANVMAGSPELLVYGMMSSLLAAAIWLVIASMMGWPVSTTHTIVGAIVGFAAVGIGVEYVQWGKVTSIVMSWVVSPVLAGTLAFFIFRSVHKLILNTDDPFGNAKRYVPGYMFLTAFMITMVTFTKGLKHVGVGLSFGESVLISVAVSFAVMLLGIALLKRVKIDEEADRHFRFASVEKVFAILMIFTACAMAFAHGSNDVANAVGPLAAIINVVANQGNILAESAMPAWVLLLGGGGIVVGLATFGYKVMGTIGRKITELTPSRGFAAELAAATTVVLASGTGLPISTTHTLVGAVLGVGMARGISALNLRVVGTIFASWIVTLPAGAFLAIIFFFMFKGIFG